MRRAIILHGTAGSPNSNWFRWLESELNRFRVDTWVPELPNADQPSLQEWLDFVHKECPFEIDAQTLIVGHSSGAILALMLAQENSKPIGAVACVSVFSNETGRSNATSFEANRRLFDVSFDWSKFPACVSERIICIHSDNDPYIPVQQARYVASRINAGFLLWRGQGHFNLEYSDKYKEFPQLLEELRDKGWVRIRGSIAAC